jgi:hypothetical protein
LAVPVDAAEDGLVFTATFFLLVVDLLVVDLLAVDLLAADLLAAAFPVALLAVVLRAVVLLGVVLLAEVLRAVGLLVAALVLARGPVTFDVGLAEDLADVFFAAAFLVPEDFAVAAFLVVDVLRAGADFFAADVAMATTPCMGRGIADLVARQ